jgi:hypothetical protein
VTKAVIILWYYATQALRDVNVNRVYTRMGGGT